MYAQKPISRSFISQTREAIQLCEYLWQIAEMALLLEQNSIEPVYVEYWQIEAILNSAANRGVRVDDLLEQVGAPGGLIGIDSKAKLRLSDYYRLQRGIARVLDDLTALLSKRKLTYQTGHFVLDQMKRSITLKDAICCLAEYFNMMHGAAYNSIRYSNDKLTLVVDDTNFPYKFRDDTQLTNFVGDTLLIKIHCLLDSIGHGLAKRALCRVGLTRQRNENGDHQVRFWNVPVHYARPVYELVYDFETACEHIPSPEAIDLTTEGIFARVIDYLEAMQPSIESLTYAVRARDLIAGGCELQSDVAAHLQVSVATLRRRLSEENSSFRELVHEDKIGRAIGLLSNGASVSHVSEQLGYSDIRAFNRAFKKWRGITPAAFVRSTDNCAAI